MPTFAEGDRVFVFKPAAKSGKAYKFARPFHGPYRIVKLYDNGVDVWPVDRPQEATIRVPFNRLRVCPEEIPNESWPPKSVQSTFTSSATHYKPTSTSVSQPRVTVTTSTPTTWNSQLHKRKAK